MRTSLIVAAGVDGEPTASVEMTFEGVASDWLVAWLVAGLVAVCCAGATSSVVTLWIGSGAIELPGLVSRVAVAVATESASVSTSVMSGSTTLLLLLLLPVLVSMLLFSAAAAADESASADGARVLSAAVAASISVDVL